MSTRTALLPNTTLRFGTETLFTIKAEAGRGGSCIVYDAVYRTNAGDEKHVRIRECYPFDLPLKREADGSLTCPGPDAERFAEARARMYEDFRLCNRLFYAETSADAIINNINIYEAGNTVYVVSAWARENVLTDMPPHSLRDCLSVVRRTAEAVASIHRAGYLYLDIKPENISVVRGGSGRIQLFDFNSLVPVSALKQGFRSFLSYTRGYAALELRRGQFSRLSFCTDIYGIGALLFYLLFGRTPEAPDCVQGAGFDFTKLKFPGTPSHKLLLRLENFFRMTLAAFPPDRWQQMDEVIRELEAMDRLADPVYPYLHSSPLNPPAFFIGRSAETETLEAWYRDDLQQNIFVTGMGGIGKSTFVRRFLAKHRGDWDSVCFLYFRNSLCQTITDDAALKINGTERFPEEKEADYFERKLRKLQEILERDRVMLVIDDFGNRHDPDLGRILALNCRKILISRQSFGSLNLPILKLDAIRDEDDLLTLFLHYLNPDSPGTAPSWGCLQTSEPAIREIIRLLGGHTLGIELFARQISNSFLTLSRAAELLRKQGLLHAGSDPVDYLRDSRITYEHLEAIITHLFETDSLSPEQSALLKALTLFPAPGIGIREFLRLSGIDSPEPVLSLVRYGWITLISARQAQPDGGTIFLHPLIRDVIRDLPLDGSTARNVQSVLRTLYDEITAESHKEEINLSSLAGKELVPLRDGSRDPSSIDLSAVLTDHRRLDRSVLAARGVIDALSADAQIAGSPMAQKLHQAMVVNLPKHEDEAILNYGMQLLDRPDHLSPLEILEVFEPVEKVLLEYQDYDAAFQLVDRAEPCAVDERTKAEFCSLTASIYDYRSTPEDLEIMLSLIDEGITHARLAPPPERKHLLAEFLLGRLNIMTRGLIRDESAISSLIRELTEIIERDCLPFSEIRCAFAIAMGFYRAELEKDRRETDRWVAAARAIGEKLYPAGLDFIDNCIIPPAIMYIDLAAYDASESALCEGIRICESYPGLIAYQRKMHDLHRYLLDVFLESENRPAAVRTLAVLDDECREYGFPDTVAPGIRQYLGSSGPKLL